MPASKHKSTVRVLVTLVAVAAGFVAAGCGLEDPYATSQTTEDRGTEDAQAATSAASDPETAGESSTGSGGAREEAENTPKEAASGAALTAGNWTTGTVDKAFRDAMRLSVGEARSEFRRQARQMKVGVKQASVEIRSKTAVEAVVVRGSGAGRRAIVVTRESVTGGEVTGEGEQYKVTLAELERLDDGWVVSRWEPQS